MKNWFLFLIPILCIISCKKDDPQPMMADDFQFTEITKLPGQLNESSGLEVTGDDMFLSFNDRGGEADLFEFNTFGSISRTIRLSNGQNEDWEDITQDAIGNIYVGDFGNNDNDRNDLVIYKIKQSDFINATNSVQAEKINFSYPEQTEFPPTSAERHFDVESMFAKGDFIYLLTKDRSSPFMGITNLYRLPNTSGTHEATLISVFNTDNDKDKGRITAADLSPDESVLAMISNEKLWLFQNFQNEDFFNGEQKKLDLPVQMAFEGLVFRDNCNLFICNEDKSGAPSTLYEIKLCQ